MKKLFLSLTIFYSTLTFSQILNETFESGTFPPAGWQVYNNGVGSPTLNWVASTTNTFLCTQGSNSPTVAYMNRETGIPAGQNAEDWLITKQVNLTGMLNIQLRFWNKMTLAGVNGTNYKIYVKSTPGAPTGIADFPAIPFAQWSEDDFYDGVIDNNPGITPNNKCFEKIVSLNAYAGQQIYIAFVMDLPGGSNSRDRWILDDVKVEAIQEPCLNSFSVLSSSTSTSSVILNLSLSTNCNASPEWQYAIGNSTPIDNSANTFTINPFTVNELSIGTHKFWVRDFPSGSWVGPVEITLDGTAPTTCNTFQGLSAGENVSSSSEQLTFIGCSAGQNAIGNSNTFMGYKAGFDSNGNNNLYLGSLSGQGIVGSGNVVLKGGLLNDDELAANSNLIFNASFSGGNRNMLFGFIEPVNAAYFNTNDKFIIENNHDNQKQFLNYFINGNFASRMLDFNVNVDEGSRVLINGSEGRSGLQFNQSFTESVPEVSNGRTLSLDDAGNVILTEGVGGGAIVTNNNVFTISSNISHVINPNNYYAIQPTPSAIRTTNTSETIDANQNSVVVSPASNLNDLITQIYNRGFRKIYFQEGMFFVNQTIDLSNKLNLTILGTGSGTVFAPNPTSNFGETPMIKLNLTQRCIIEKIKFFHRPTANNDTGIVKTIFQFENYTFGNIIKDIVIDGNKIVDTNSIELSSIKILLDNNDESYYNTFENIYFWLSQRSFLFNVNGGNFNHNTFKGIHLHHFKTGIDFGNIGNGNIEGNLFLDFDCQALGAVLPGPEKPFKPTVTYDVVKNIWGNNNTFRNFNIADYNPLVVYIDQNNVTFADAYVFRISTTATRTVIENTETSGDFHQWLYNGGAKQGWYIDNGKGTQFFNNASPTRITDYVANDVNEVVFRAQLNLATPPNNVAENNYDQYDHPNRNNLFFKDFGRVRFDGKKNNDTIVDDFNRRRVHTLFDVTNYKYINIGNPSTLSSVQYLDIGKMPIHTLNNSEPFDRTISETLLGGMIRFMPHTNGIASSATATMPNQFWLKYITPIGAPLCVITNRDNRGTMQWTPISNLIPTIYSNDGTITTDRIINITENKKLSFSNGLAIKNDRVIVGKSINGTNDLFSNTTLSSYNFIVNGKAWVKTEVNIQSTGITWPDYVFAKDYKLQSLSVVESYIKNNGHLPNMPSATEIEEKGLPVAEITTKQQEKIEELTLYVIEQDKKLQAQQKEIDELKNLVQQVLQKQENHEK